MTETFNKVWAGILGMLGFSNVSQISAERISANTLAPASQSLMFLLLLTFILNNRETSNKILAGEPF